MSKSSEYIGAFVEAVLAEDSSASVTVRAIESGLLLEIKRYTETRKYLASHIVLPFDLEQTLYSSADRAKDQALRSCSDMAKMIIEDK